MAAFSGNGTGTLTANARLRVQRGDTFPLPHQDVLIDEEPAQSPEERTVPRVRRVERGNADTRDLYAPGVTEPTTSDVAGEPARNRAEIAGQLSTAISHAIAGHGSVKLAAALQILRRELSRCHDALGPFPTESDFLSIVTLVEMEIGGRNWKEISKQELEALKLAVEVGVKEPLVTFDHYNKALRRLNASGWVTGPSLDLSDSEVSQDEQI